MGYGELNDIGHFAIIKIVMQHKHPCQGPKVSHDVGHNLQKVSTIARRKKSPYQGSGNGPTDREAAQRRPTSTQLRARAAHGTGLICSCIINNELMAVSSVGLECADSSCSPPLFTIHARAGRPARGGPGANGSGYSGPRGPLKRTLVPARPARQMPVHYFIIPAAR